MTFARCYRLGVLWLACLVSCSRSAQESTRRAPVEYYHPSFELEPLPEKSRDTGAPRSTSLEHKPHAAAPECNNRPGQLFPPAAPWNTPIADKPLAWDSDYIIRYLEKRHREYRFQIDFSLVILNADADTAKHEFVPSASHYSPDCDLAPVPLPSAGRLEAESDYSCTGDGDCHLIVVAEHECRLYEMWRADVRGSAFDGGCLAVWDLATVPPETGRGDQCTSADAAGLPIAPLTVTPEEVASGEIRHALRFVLPNANIRHKVYVRPGTHSTPTTSGPADAPPYAALLRLKAGTDLSQLNPAARVVAKALQTYGMYLADGGKITFTMGERVPSTTDWSDVGLGPRDLMSLSWTDFEVVEKGDRLEWTGDCKRDPVEE